MLLPEMSSFEKKAIIKLLRNVNLDVDFMNKIELYIHV
jgi:hypothetical protein